MSQHIQHHHPQQPQYVHYTGPSNPGHPYVQNVGLMHQGLQGQPQHMHHILHYQQPIVQQPITQPMPIHQPQVQQQTTVQQPSNAATSIGGSSSNTGSGPVVATGDWTKDLVQLAKQAELKKHALTLQLHTAHILSAHASLEQKAKAIQDIKEQKNKLESERTRLLKCLQDINVDRDRADLAEGTMQRECDDLRSKITQLSEGEYAIAKSDVDRLRTELGQPPLPSLQQMLEERTSQYLNERRLNGNEPEAQQQRSATSTPGPSNNSAKRGPPTETPQPESQAKRPRGRPKGSKNKKNTST